jgi:serine/threonine protein phosphatase PrpC
VDNARPDRTRVDPERDASTPCIGTIAPPAPGEVWSPQLAGLWTDDLKYEDAKSNLETVVNGELLSLVAVADGHGGSRTSRWLSENVLKMIASVAPDGSSNALHATCRKVFAESHEKVKALDAETGGKNTAGATLTVLIFNHQRREITCANVGDSLALLAHEKGHTELTVSHRLVDSEMERTRLLEKGIRMGRAMDHEGWPAGPLRAWPGGLAVTRGIGDADCEDIVSCEPSCQTVPAPPHGGVLLACSDGVWDTLTIEKAAKLLTSKTFASPAQAAKMIVKRAVARCGLLDDTSASLLFFDAADVKAQKTFLTERFKGSKLAYWRPATVEMRQAAATGNLRYSVQNLDDSKHGDTDDDGSKHSDGSLYGGTRMAGIGVDSFSAHAGAAYDVVAQGQNAHGPTVWHLSDAPLKPPKNSDDEIDGLPSRPRRISHKDMNGVPVAEREAEMGTTTTVTEGGPGVVKRAATSGSTIDDQIARARANSEKLAAAGGQTIASVVPGAASAADVKVEPHPTAGAPAGRASNKARRGSVFSGNANLNALSLAEEEMALWVGREEAQVIEWQSLDEESMTFLGQGEFARAYAMELKGKQVAVKVLKKEKREDAWAVRGLKRASPGTRTLLSFAAGMPLNEQRSSRCGGRRDHDHVGHEPPERALGARARQAGGQPVPVCRPREAPHGPEQDPPAG